MLTFILNTTAFTFLLWGLYRLFLKRETFFSANRWYLLVIPVFALMLPLAQFDVVTKTIAELDFTETVAMITLPDIHLLASETTSYWSLYTILMWVYSIGVLGFTTRLIWRYVQILKLQRTGEQRIENGCIIVRLSSSDLAFSFMHKIYLSDAYKGAERQQIIAHEAIHIHYKHSWDLLFYEVLKIALWFNPVLYWLQRDLTEVHEYMTDAAVVRYQSKKTYTNHLLNAGFACEQVSFTNSFFNQKSLKNRILMLHKKQSNRIAKLKFLFAVPLLLLMLTYVSCSDDAPALKQQAQQGKALTGNEPEAVREDMVPFRAIEEIPNFMDSPSFDDKEKAKSYFTAKIQKFVSDHFKVNNVKAVAGKGINRINVQFTIDKEGYVTNVKARAKYKALQEEAIRVVKQLPRFIPGEHDGKPVRVVYSLPIVFKNK